MTQAVRNTLVTRRGALPLGVLLLVLVGLIAGPAAAQQPYPPVTPGEPEPWIECHLRVTPDQRIAECFGEHLDPDAEITIEVTIAGGQQAAAAPALAAALLLAQAAEYEDEEQVDPDGSGYVAVGFPCEVDGVATIRGESVGENGEPVSDEIVRDLADFPCPTERDDRTTPVVTDQDRTAPPRLAFTGTDWLLLLLIALLLILAGVGILRSRRRRPA